MKKKWTQAAKDEKKTTTAKIKQTKLYISQNN